MDYRIAVCDDREEDRSFARESVLQWAEKRGFDVDVQEFPSGDAFLFHYTEDRAWDILLLDVEMPGCSGVDLAKQVRKDSQLLQIVFLTGYSDYLAEGYDVSALHYLLKPIHREKLWAVLDRAVEHMEVRGNYVTVHTAAEAYRVKKTLSAMEQELDDRFFRIGRSYILNLGKVRKVTKREVQLFSGSRLPLPRGMYEPLNRAIIQKL